MKFAQTNVNVFYLFCEYSSASIRIESFVRTQHSFLAQNSHSMHMPVHLCMHKKVESFQALV